MLKEGGLSESGESKTVQEKREQVLGMLEEKLTDLRSFGGKTGEAVIPRYQDLITRIVAGDDDAYHDAAREFGLEEVEIGEQSLDSKGMKVEKISDKRRDEIEKDWAQYK